MAEAHQHYAQLIESLSAAVATMGAKLDAIAAAVGGHLTTTAGQVVQQPGAVAPDAVSAGSVAPGGPVAPTSEPAP